MTNHAHHESAATLDITVIKEFLTEDLGVWLLDFDDESFALAFRGSKGPIVVHGTLVKLAEWSVLVCECRCVAQVDRGHKRIDRLLHYLNRQTFAGQWQLDPDGEVLLRSSVCLSANDWQEQIRFALGASSKYAEEMQKVLADNAGADCDVHFLSAPGSQ